MGRRDQNLIPGTCTKEDPHWSNMDLRECDAAELEGDLESTD